MGRDGHRALATAVAPARRPARVAARATRRTPGRAAPRRPGPRRRTGPPAGAGSRRCRLPGRAGGRPSRGRTPGRAHRRLPPRPAARRGRDGPGLAGVARGRAVRPQGRAEAAAPRPGGSAAAPTLRARARDPRALRASVYRPPAGCRLRCGRPALPRPRVRRWRADHRLLPKPPARHRRAARPVPPGLRSSQPRACEPHRPSRPEAVEHPGHPGGPRPPARLRHRQAAGCRAAPGGTDADGRAHLHPALRGTRTDPRRTGHHHDRRVFARRGAVRTADGLQALPAEAPDRRRMGGSDPRRRTAAAIAGGRARGSARYPPVSARQACARTHRRPRQHRAEGPGQATGAALRLGRGAGARPALLPARTAGGRTRGEHALPRAQVPATAPLGDRRHQPGAGGAAHGAGGGRLAVAPGDARGGARPGDAELHRRPVRKRGRDPDGRADRLAQAAGHGHRPRRFQPGPAAAGARGTLRRGGAPAPGHRRLP